MVTQNNRIDTLLATYKTVLKDDFSTYKNHLYRMYNYAILLDDDKNNDDKYAIAAVFHDLGIWTHSFDYLKPSITLATEYLTRVNKKEWVEEISLMIDHHHKMSIYKGNYPKTVEVFRKADWIDVTWGIKKYALKPTDFKAIKKNFPNKGFHLFLLKQFFKWFVKHPFNALPMFKK